MVRLLSTEKEREREREREREGERRINTQTRRAIGTHTQQASSRRKKKVKNKDQTTILFAPDEALCDPRVSPRVALRGESTIQLELLQPLFLLATLHGTRREAEGKNQGPAERKTKRNRRTLFSILRCILCSGVSFMRCSNSCFLHEGAPDTKKRIHTAMLTSGSFYQVILKKQIIGNSLVEITLRSVPNSESHPQDKKK